MRPAQQNSAAIPGTPHKPASFEQRPGLFAGLLFLLLFSGPPKFRLRDPMASLYGEVDLAIILNIAVWGVGGLWVLCQLWGIYSGKRPQLRLWLPQKLAALVILFLGISTFASLAPLVTAVKVYQILVAFLFTLIFVEWYGVEVCLNRLFLGSALLCVAIAVSVFVAPDLVLFTSETDFPRLRGMGITETGAVATFSVIFLMTTKRRMSKLVFVSLAAFFGGILFFSLGRIAWVTVCAFFALALLKRPQIRSLPWVYLFWVLAAVALAAGFADRISELRDPESIYTLSERLGLWAHFTTGTLTQSPWLGLGYLAGSRELGMQYDPLLGSGHSIFFDVFVGGGILSISVFLLLFIILSVHATKLFRERKDAVSFTVSSLFLMIFLFGFIGEDIDSSPFGFTFWCLVTMLPFLRNCSAASFVRSAPQMRPLRLQHLPSLPSENPHGA